VRRIQRADAERDLTAARDIFAALLIVRSVIAFIASDQRCVNYEHHAGWTVTERTREIGISKSDWAVRRGIMYHSLPRHFDQRWRAVMGDLDRVLLVPLVCAVFFCRGTCRVPVSPVKRGVAFCGGRFRRIVFVGISREPGGKMAAD